MSRTIFLSTSLALLGCALSFLTGCTASEESPRRAPDWDTSFTVGTVAFPNDTATGRGLITTTSNARMERFFDKVRGSRSVRIAFLGGSVTQGHFSSHQDLRYSTLFCRFLQRAFPHLDTVIEINAGVTATGSRYGASRAAEDILSQNPDLIVLEHTVNDNASGPDDRLKATYEGVIRQCLKHDPDVPVIALFTSNPFGDNAQALHAPVAAHYGVPMISYRDAIWPYVSSGRLTFDDIFYDMLSHPNDGGMVVAGHLLYTYVKRAAGLRGTGGDVMPAPLMTDLFEYAGILSEGDSAVKFDLGTWQKLPREKGRYAFTTLNSLPSTFVLRTRKREVTLGIHMQTQDTSSIRVVMSGHPDRFINNYHVFDYTKHVHLYTADTAGLVTIEIHHSGSKFTIDHILYAGAEE